MTLLFSFKSKSEKSKARSPKQRHRVQSADSVGSNPTGPTTIIESPGLPQIRAIPALPQPRMLTPEEKMVAKYRRTASSIPGFISSQNITIGGPVGKALLEGKPIPIPATILPEDCRDSSCICLMSAKYNALADTFELFIAHNMKVNMISVTLSLVHQAEADNEALEHQLQEATTLNLMTAHIQEGNEAFMKAETGTEEPPWTVHEEDADWY